MEDPNPISQTQTLLSKLTQEQRKVLDNTIIKQTFDDVKKFTVGITKPGNKNVTAKRVMNIQPFFESIPNRMTIAIFDHDIHENLHETAKQQLKKTNALNELLIMKKFGKGTNRSAAIYTKTTEDPLVELREDEQIALRSTEYQHMREYDYFISTEAQLRHNILLYLKSDHVRYIKPSAIFTMNKKKVNEEFGSEIPQKLLIDARGYTSEEITRNNNKYEEIGVNISN